MIKLNDDAILVIENKNDDDTLFQCGYILYSDGFIFDLGRVIGNFLYDKNYVYKWSITKGYPDIFDIANKQYITDIDERHELTDNLFKLIKK